MGLYAHYDHAHNHPVNRALHMLAIPTGFSSIFVVWFHPIIAALLIPLAFAMAWVGHFIEGNKPAFLTNPAHVFVAIDIGQFLWAEVTPEAVRGHRMEKTWHRNQSSPAS